MSNAPYDVGHRDGESSLRADMDVLREENASLRKQLDEAREREATMADGMVALVKLHASELAHMRAANAQMAATLREIEYLDRPQVRGLPRRKSIQQIALDALAALSQEPPASHAPNEALRTLYREGQRIEPDGVEDSHE